MFDEIYPTLRKIAPGRSCAACQRRKIRCDRGHPCAYCVRLGCQCNYISTAAKKRSIRSDVAKTTRSLEIQHNRAIDRKAEFALDRKRDGSCSVIGHLVTERNQSRFVSGSLWLELDREYKLGAVKHKEQTVPIPRRLSMQHESLLFGGSPSGKVLTCLHPSTDRIFSIWHLYLTNVDPLLRLCHNPTVQSKLLDAVNDISCVAPNFESLMFAIYYSVASSLQCLETYKNLFGSERQELLARYSRGVETALAKAHFMDEPDLCSLQALTLYLICARHDLSRSYVWVMTGLAVRLATRLGLHRDPSLLNLGVLESDVRRLLWWQILVLDALTAEENDMDPSIYEHSFDTQFPLEDHDLNHNAKCEKVPIDDMQSYPLDMIFALQRLKISYASRKLLFSEQFAVANDYKLLSLAEKIIFLDQLQIDLKNEQVISTGEASSVNKLTNVAGNLVIAKMQLQISYLGCQKSPENLRKLVEQSIEIVQVAQDMRKEPLNHKWTWLFQRYVEWDAVAILVRGLETITCPDLKGHAKSLVDTFFNDWRDHVPDKMGNERWRQLEMYRISNGVR